MYFLIAIDNVKFLDATGSETHLFRHGEPMELIIELGSKGKFYTKTLM